MENFLDVNNLFDLTITDGVPKDTKKDGSYRLFGTVTLNLCCANSQLLFPVLSDVDKGGGVEAFGFKGTSNAITKLERLSASDVGLTLRVWGRPDLRAELGLQAIRKRRSVNIWSHDQILFRCTGGKLSYTIRAFSGGQVSFPKALDQ